MRTIAWVAAALAVAYTTGCKDRDHRDADTTSEQATAEVREGAHKTGDAVDNAADKTGDAVDDAADKTADATKDAGDKVGNAVEDAADETGLSEYAYDKRDEFREDVNERLAAMDKQLADLRQGVNKNAGEAHNQAVAAAEATRKTVGRNVDRLAGATAANWDAVEHDVRTSVDSLGRQLRALQPDAKPMGGTGPS
jgi:gas vesicle protein